MGQGLSTMAGVDNLHRVEVRAGKFLPFAASSLPLLSSSDLGTGSVFGLIVRIFAWAGLQFLYVRDNALDSFAIIGSLFSLRVLDASCNCIRDWDQFQELPSLRQLYLSNNGISSFRGMPLLPELGVLSLTGNVLESFEGMKVYPELRMLSLPFNRINSLRGFVRHPKLEVLDLTGNPITREPQYRPAVIACCSRTLLKLDGEGGVAALSSLSWIP